MAFPLTSVLATVYRSSKGGDLDLENGNLCGGHAFVPFIRKLGPLPGDRDIRLTQRQ